MSKNKLLIAAAGAGKTTFLVKEALKQNGNVLITTYTEANEEEIRRKFIRMNKTVPGNVVIQTWFSFLMQHGMKPYQGSLFEKKITGLHFTQTQSGFRFQNKKTKQPVYYSEDDYFEQHYFNTKTQIYSDKLSKFVVRCNEKTTGKVIDRISRIYPFIYVDEVQDLAGWDLEVLRLLFQSKSNIVLVGDPRQVTYLTHHDKKYSQYKDGKIEDFIAKECKKLDCETDKDTLKFSHRNNAEISKFSSLLYPGFPASEPCTCQECRSNIPEHTGIFLIKPDLVPSYIDTYKPVILRYRGAEEPEWNFGKAKGLGFDRVLIHPTDTFKTFLSDGKLTKTVAGKVKDAFDIAKFYVGITRARHSVGIVCDYKDDDVFIDGVKKY